MSVRPILGVYFKAKNIGSLVNFWREEPKPLEKEIFFTEPKKSAVWPLKKKQQHSVDMCSLIALEYFDQSDGQRK